MYKVILVCLMSFAMNIVNGQQLWKVQTPEVLELIKKQLSAKKADSIKKNTPTTSSIATENSSDANTPPVILPSPNSSSLLNLVSDNVDLYTGKTNISLPLYTVKCGSISLPISLQSNVNAHKVNDIGSSVGLGMNLNAGGTISRVMKNLPDEFTGNICPAFNIPGWGYLTMKAGEGIDLVNFDNYSTQLRMDIVARGNWNKKNNLLDKAWDVQADEFFFSFGTYSGKFVFDQDGGVQQIPRSNLKITPSFQVVNGNNKIIGFTVLTEDGFKYEFGTLSGGSYSSSPVEESKLTVNTSSIAYTYRAIAGDINGVPVIIDGYLFRNMNTWYYAYEREPYLMGAVEGYSGNSPTNPSLACCLQNFDLPENNENTEYFSFPSSWMLTKITSPTGDFINLNYSAANNISYLADRSFSTSLPDLAEDNTFPTPQGNKLIFTSPVEPRWDANRRLYTLPSRQYFTITKSTVNLSARKLMSIVTSDNTIVNFNSTTAREDLLNDNRLDNITVLNAGNNLVKKFDLNYNVITTTTTDLPDEQFKFFYHRSRFWYTSGSPASYIGMHSNFVLYNNQITAEEDIRNTGWAVPTECRKRMFLTSVQEEGNGILTPAYLFNYDNTAKLPFRTSVDQDYYGYASPNTSKNPFVGTGFNSMFTYNYVNPYNGTTVTAPAQFSGIYNPILFFKTMNSSGTWTNPLYGGFKSASVSAMQAGVLNKITYSTGGYKEFLFDFSGNSTAWNGLRISQSKGYESAIANPIITNYAYGTFVNTDVCILNYNMPENAALAYINNAWVWVFPTKRQFFNQNRANPETLTRGSAGGYTYAEVSQPNNGISRVEFYTAADPLCGDVPTNTRMVSNQTTNPITILPINTYPFPPGSSYDWKRGLPKKEIIKSASGATLKSEEYTYPSLPNQYGVKVIPSFSVTRYDVADITSPLVWVQRLYGTNYYISSWHPMTNKLSRMYEQNGTNYTESTDNYDYRVYTYNNIDYLLPYQQKNLKNSRNEQTVSYSKFPFDYNLANTNDPFIQGMANLLTKHVIGAKVEQYNYRQDQSGNNKKYIGAVLTKYHPDKPLPKEVFKLKTNGLLNTFTESNTNSGWFAFDANYNSEVNFPLYDANGRTLEQNKTSDITETYIWNYNKMYPVAKAVNANNNEIAFTSFEADEAGSNFTFNTANIINNPAGSFTGKKYFLLTDPSLVSTNINVPGKEYKLTYWYKSDQPFAKPIIINNTTTITPFPNSIKTTTGWNYCEYTVPASFTGSLSISKNAAGVNVYLDEVRFYPVLSQMNTYTFDPLIGMTSETDVNGKTTYYEYDALNRLAFVKNEDKDIVKTICYNYANLVVPCEANAVTCPAPVINSVVRTGGFVVVLDFTAPPNSTNCTITVHDKTDNIFWFLPQGCNSPRTFNVDYKFHQYEIMVKSFSAACPNGTESPWVSF